MANVAEFLDAAEDGNLPCVQKMLADGDLCIADAAEDGSTALLYAALGGSDSLPTLKLLLEEGGARITERDHRGITVLLFASLIAAINGNFKVCQWLLEHGGANIAEANDEGQMVWTILTERLCRGYLADEVTSTALMCAMVVRGVPPADFVAQLRLPEHTRVVEEGARLRVALPAPPRRSSGPQGSAWLPDMIPPTNFARGTPAPPHSSA
jgi:ankyrin repeat protein